MTSSQTSTSRVAQFIIGGLAGVTATTIVHPLEVIKNRMQVSGIEAKGHQSFLNVAHTILKTEGMFSFYNGVSAAWLKQSTYTSVRLGVYNSAVDHYISNYGTNPTFITKMGIGSLAGGIGAIFGTPAEVIMVRMTIDGKLPPAERRNYSNSLSALAQIIKEEGISKLWCGVIPTVIRAMIGNSVQLGVYSQSKELFQKSEMFDDGLGLHFCSGTIAGFFNVVASLPADTAKTRLQNMKVVNGKPEYTGAIDVLKRTIKDEGFFALWKGFTPCLLKVCPGTILTLMFVEHYTNLYKNMAI